MSCKLKVQELFGQDNATEEIAFYLADQIDQLKGGTMQKAEADPRPVEQAPEKAPAKES